MRVRRTETSQRWRDAVSTDRNLCVDFKTLRADIAAQIHWPNMSLVHGARIICFQLLLTGNYSVRPASQQCG